MLCIPTLFDAANPQMLNGQPRCADDESGTGQGRQRQTDVMVTGGKRRQARDEQHQSDADDDEPRHDLVVLHRLAGMRPRRPRVVDRIFRAFHGYSSLGIPMPAVHGLISTVELPGAVVGGTNITGRARIARIRVQAH